MRALTTGFDGMALQGFVMWEELGRAFCLVLVLEGIIPFLYPTRWRHLVVSLAQVSDRQLRSMGLVSMLIGIGLLYLLK
jgi:uncharacterized protein